MFTRVKGLTVINEIFLKHSSQASEGQWQQISQHYIIINYLYYNVYMCLSINFIHNKNLLKKTTQSDPVGLLYISYKEQD
jgi:hypothetical protein